MCSTVWTLTGVKQGLCFKFSFVFFFPFSFFQWVGFHEISQISIPHQKLPLHWNTLNRSINESINKACGYCIHIQTLFVVLWADCMVLTFLWIIPIMPFQGTVRRRSTKQLIFRLHNLISASWARILHEMLQPIMEPRIHCRPKIGYVVYIYIIYRCLTVARCHLPELRVARQSIEYFKEDSKVVGCSIDNFLMCYIWDLQWY